MAVDLRVAGGTVLTSDGAAHTDLLIDGGKIVGLVSPGLSVSDVGSVYDATGLYVLPGMVDVHVHTREPGYTHKEDIKTTTEQAAVGGVTTIFGMPNLDPPTTTLESLDDVFALYSSKSLVDWNHNPAPTIPDQIGPMAKRGVRAFKIYMVRDTGRSYPHPPGTAMHDAGQILRTMDLIKDTGCRLIIHPHDQALMDYIEGEILGAGDNTPAGYARAYAAREGVIWDTATDLLIRLADASGCPIHIAHVQTRRAVEAIRRAKEDGVDVTCEVNHWAMFLGTWAHIEKLGPYALSYWVPDEARESVLEGMRSGIVDICSSDHAPHTREEKEIGWSEMWACHTGTPGIQYFYPLLIDAALQGLFSLSRLVEMVAEAPADAFGLSSHKGRLAPGMDADLVVVDPDATWTISNEDALSRCGWTPYDGVECRARIESTFLRGVEIYRQDGLLGEPGFGKLAESSNRRDS